MGSRKTGESTANDDYTIRTHAVDKILLMEIPTSRSRVEKVIAEEESKMRKGPALVK
jgi:hypothetical protein